MEPSSIEARLLKQPCLIKNKFLKWYALLIAQRILNPPDGDFEKHHILPRSIGGTDDADNLVKLTPREHFVAHRLLTKCTEGKAKRSMCLGLSFFMTVCGQHKRTLTAKQYEEARKAVRKNIPIFEMINGIYRRHEDFYRFCDNEKIGRGNLQAKLRQNEVAVITSGKHRGRAFSFADVGEDAMLLEIDRQLGQTKNLRANSVYGQWKTQPKKSSRGRNVSLKDPSGKIYTFESMLAAQETTGIPWSTLQSCKKQPHTFKYGQGAGWTLISIESVRQEQQNSIV